MAVYELQTTTWASTTTNPQSYAILYAVQHYLGRCQQSVQDSRWKCLLFVITNGKLQVHLHNTLLLVIRGGVAYQLENLSCQVFHGNRDVLRSIIASQSRGRSINYKQLPEHRRPLNHNPMQSYMQYNTTLADVNSPFNLQHKIRRENAYSPSLRMASCKCLHTIRCFLSSRASPTSSRISAAKCSMAIGMY